MKPNVIHFIFIIRIFLLCFQEPNSFRIAAGVKADSLIMTGIAKVSLPAERINDRTTTEALLTSDYNPDLTPHNKHTTASTPQLEQYIWVRTG